MMKSAIIAAATVLAISTGVFGVSSASADTVRQPSAGQHHSENWRGDYRYGRHHAVRPYGRHVHGPVRLCKPILRTVKVRGHHGWHFKRIVVGERCHFVRRGW